MPVAVGGPLRDTFRLPNRPIRHPLRSAVWPAVFLMSAALGMAPNPRDSSARDEPKASIQEAKPSVQEAKPSIQEGPKPPFGQLARRLREGAELVDQVGLFQVTGERVAFVADPGNRRFIVLENLSLDQLRTLAERPQNSQWKVSGTVTEYRGTNFILIRRAVLRGPAPLDTHPGGTIMGDTSERPMPGGNDALPAGTGKELRPASGPSR